MSATVLAGQGPEVEVVAKAARRRFTVEYKRKIVREADACKTPGRAALRTPTVTCVILTGPSLASTTLAA